VLEHMLTTETEAQTMLAKVSSWLAPPADPQVVAFTADCGILAAAVHMLRRFSSEPLVAALACTLVTRLGQAENVSAQVKTDAVEQTGNFMALHPGHGGVQNVGLLLLCEFLKNNGIARHAVSLGVVSWVLRAMSATMGREVQYNGCMVLRTLAHGGRAPRAGLHDAMKRIQDAVMRAKASYQTDTALSVAADEVLALVTPRFKEVLCWHWQSGWCRLGPRCTYAHGPQDLRNM